MSYTQGPWKAWYADTYWFVDRDDGSKEHKLENQIATLDGYNNSFDSRLIAAAPHLLEVCEEALHWLAYNKDHLFKLPKGSPGDRLVEKLEDAITKAIHG